MPLYNSSYNKQTIHLQGFRNVIGNQTQKTPPLIGKTPQNKQTPFCVSISNKMFDAHPPPPIQSPTVDDEFKYSDWTLIMYM